MMVTLMAQIAPSSNNPEAMIAAAVAAAQAQQSAFNASMVSLVVMALVLIVLIVLAILVYRIDALVRITDAISRKLGKDEAKASGEPKGGKEVDG